MAAKGTAKEKKIKKFKRAKFLANWHVTPLKGSFMVMAIIGFLATAYIIYPFSFNYGVAFMIVFAAMFIASLISMSRAPLPD